MTEEHGMAASGLPEVATTEQGLSATELSTLLLLLADTRELAEQSRAERADAEARADRAGSKAETLQIEIDGMTTALASLEAQLMSAVAALESAEARVQALEGELALTQQRAVSAEGSLVHLVTARAEVAASEAALPAELADMRQSTSWRATAPIRSVAGALHRNHVAP